MTSRSDICAGEVTGSFYDGASSRAHQVQVSLKSGQCAIAGDSIDRSFPFDDIVVSEPLHGAARLLRFPDGSSCEVPDSPALSALLAQGGHREPLVVRMQRKWRWIAVSVVVLVAVLAAAYQWVLPFAAEKLAYRLPDKALTLISQQALTNLDGKFLGPSALPADRQQRLQDRFARVDFPPNTFVATTIQFRSSAFAGANAFALPDGTIVFFDKLVELAANDDELVSVFAHEAGHVALRHGVRQMIQSSIVGLVLAAYIGDVSALAGALSGWLLEANYSRNFEREADRYAAAVLRHNNLSPALLGTFLMKLENDHGRNKRGSGGNNLFDYLSSHPATRERMKELESLSR
ncbi:MAG TPA: M48 family metallopeptidase [Dissulfurispiraceae bacterium]|nr:M48 family metallopeptidase [Dissulfurispiraceae bacterium]